MNKEGIKKQEKKEFILKEYDENQSIYISFLSQIENLVKSFVDIEEIKISSIHTRIKERDSLSKKIKDKQKVIIDKDRDVFKYESISDITDICGLRICTFYSDDVEKIAAIIEEEFIVDKENSIDKRAAIDPSRFGYMSVHYIVSLPPERLSLKENKLFEGLKVEIQIRTILQHTWAEIEHDLGYKSTEEIPRDIERDFSRLSGLLELADKEFLGIRKGIEEYQQKVKVGIQENIEENILIDKVSFLEFRKGDYFQSVLDHIARETNQEPAYFIQENDISKYMLAFKNYGIHTIKDLIDLLEQTKTFMSKYINEFDSDEENFSERGVIYFALYYNLLDKGYSKSELSKLYDMLGVTAETTLERAYQEINKIYKEMQNKK